MNGFGPHRALIDFGSSLRWLSLLLTLGACHEHASSPPKPLVLDTSCEHDWECVPEPECCPVPCNEVVINQREEQRARAALDCSATEKHGCAQAGGCRTFAYLCLDKRCRLSFDGDPNFRKRESPPSQ
jgi:hypothetical protein